MEIWKDIPNQSPNYQISNIGNVRSLDYNRTGIARNLAKYASFGRNHCVRIGNKAHSVAQFVLLAFVGQRPSLAHFAHHKDGNSLNDCVENLEWQHIGVQNRINGKNGFKFKEGHTILQDTQLKTGKVAGFDTRFQKGNTVGKNTQFKKKKPKKSTRASANI